MSSGRRPEPKPSAEDHRSVFAVARLRTALIRQQAFDGALEQRDVLFAAQAMVTVGHEGKGHRVVAAMLDELERNGYLCRFYKRTPDGRIAEAVYEIYELPTLDKPTLAQPTPELPPP